MKKDELIGGSVVFLFGAVTTIFSLQLPIGTFRRAGDGLFPLCLGLILMFLSLLFVLQVFFRKEPRGEDAASGSAIPGSAKQVLLFLGAAALATALLNSLGYLLTALFLMLALLRLLGMKRWVPLALFSLISAGASHLLFVYWLKIPLPRGWLDF